MRICELRSRETLTEHGAPGLVDDVQANRAGHLVHIRVEHAVFEADRGGLEGVLLRQSDMDLPSSSLVRSCDFAYRRRDIYFLHPKEESTQHTKNGTIKVKH